MVFHGSSGLPHLRLLAFHYLALQIQKLGLIHKLPINIWFSTRLVWYRWWLLCWLAAPVSVGWCWNCRPGPPQREPYLTYPHCHAPFHLIPFSPHFSDLPLKKKNELILFYAYPMQFRNLLFISRRLSSLVSELNICWNNYTVGIFKEMYLGIMN